MYVCVTPTPLKPGALTEPEMMGCGEERGPALRWEPSETARMKSSPVKPVIALALRNTGQLEQQFKRTLNHTADFAFTGKAFFFCCFLRIWGSCISNDKGVTVTTV